MSKNRGVVYVKPGVVEVRDIVDPKFEDPHGRKINHAARWSPMVDWFSTKRRRNKHSLRLDTPQTPRQLGIVI